MIELVRILAWRALRRSPARSLLVVASIALGVATLVSSRLLTQTIEQAVSLATRPLEGAADLYVTNGDAGVRLELADRLRRVPGVRAVEPLVVERVLLPDRNGRTAVLLGVETRGKTTEAGSAFGVTVTPAEPTRLALALLSGRPAFLGQQLADDLGHPDSLRLGTGDRVETLRPAGTVSLSGPAAQLGRSLIVTEVALAAKLAGRPGVATRIDVFTTADADRQGVREAIATALTGAARVESAESHGQASNEVMAGVQVGFTLFGAGALVVGLFLVYNALSVSVVERRHDIGILRSLGATRGQIARLFASEAVLLGSAGAILGVPTGYALAQAGLSLMETTLKEMTASGEPIRVRLDAMTVSLGLIAGVLTTLLAALVPALQAASDEPADAVRRSPTGSSRFLLVSQSLAALAFAAVGLVLVLSRAALPLRWGTYGGLALALVGLLLAAPLVTAIASWLLRPIVRWCFGIEARLAADNLARTPGRTGLVVGALAAGVCLVLQVAGLGRTLKEPILGWIDTAVQADLFVSSGGPGGAEAALPLGPETVDLLLALPGVEQVMPVRHRILDYSYTAVMIVGLDAEAYRSTISVRRPFPGLEVYRGLTQPGTAVVAENFAALHAVGPGDTITLPGPAGPVSLHVIGTVEDYRWNRGSVIVDRQATYIPLFEDPLIDVVSVFARPMASAEERDAVRRAVEAAGAERAWWVLDREELNGFVRRLLEQPFVVAYVQQMVLGLVAALGVVTALLIAVLQRRRELGLLRAVGATRGQVMRTVLAEAALIGLVGTLLGVAAGVPMLAFVVRVIIMEESGFVLPLSIPWGTVLGLASASIGLAALAGLAPAWHASRQSVVEAVAWE